MDRTGPPLGQGPFASQISVNNVIVLSNLSQISPSFPIEPCLLLSQIIFPPMPLSPPPISCLSHSPVIPGHAQRVLGPTLTSPIPTFRVWLEWASPSLKVSTSGMRQDHFVRPSCPASLWMLACSLYHPLVRTGKAEMNYIADYPAVAGSPTRLHGSSGQRGLVAKKTTTQTSVTEPKVNDPGLLTRAEAGTAPWTTCSACGRCNSITASFTHAGSLTTFCRHTLSIAHTSRRIFLLASSK